MRLPRILSLACVREILVYALVGFTLFTVVVVTANLLRRLEELVAVGFLLSDFGRMLGCLLAMFAPYAVPVSFLFGVLVTMGRISADSELTAMRACGIGLGQIVVPVLVLATLVSAATGVMLVELEPRARRELREVLNDVASRGSLLEVGRFKGLGKRVVFVRDRDRENRLQGVMVSDRSNDQNPFTVFAETGRFEFDQETGVMTLALEDGDIHFEPALSAPQRYRRISFQEVDYRVDLGDLFKAELRMARPHEMTFAELEDAIARTEAGGDLSDLREKEPEVYRVELHRRLALPFAPLLFALVGVPLGVRRSRGARSWGAIVSALVVFLYYTLLSFGEDLGEGGALPAFAALWIPNAVFAAAAFVLLRRARHAEI